MNKYIRKLIYKIYYISGNFLLLEVEDDWAEEREHEPDIESYPEHVYVKEGESVAEAIHKAGPGAHIYVMREGSYGIKTVRENNETQT